MVTQFIKQMFDTFSLETLYKYSETVVCVDRNVVQKPIVLYVNVNPMKYNIMKKTIMSLVA